MSFWPHPLSRAISSLSLQRMPSRKRDVQTWPKVSNIDEINQEKRKQKTKGVSVELGYGLSSPDPSPYTIPQQLLSIAFKDYTDGHQKQVCCLQPFGFGLKHIRVDPDRDRLFVLRDDNTKQVQVVAAG
ncbi:hypothetical protein OUZ56_008555 [Daphnia magna]|uniref:Uncharacterized protein n=1 Tax=Daphnia magna TaxID=35525 RepID=A0ABR0ADK4_9CRUS|nr:hypothetical protein OUZ56_008555 [Daphnia magna]